jgi:recombinational DNA repair protein RecT
MYDAFAWFAKNGKEISVGIKNENNFIEVKNDNVTYIMPSIRTLNGYETTEHSKKNDITKEWKKFTMDDCANKGKIDKRRNLRVRLNLKY